MAHTILSKTGSDWCENGMKKRTGIFLLAVLCVWLAAGCKVTDMSSDKTQNLEYTVVKEEDLPQEVSALIEERKTKEFQMTYQIDEDLYLIRGYGQQMSGGYSIQVEEVSLGENAIYFKTTLIGPSKGEEVSKEPSYPYIVVKIGHREEPVQFQ